MQFTYIVATLAAAMTVSASPLEARAGSVRANFYSPDGGCEPRNNPLAVQVWNDVDNECHDVTIGPFTSTWFNQSTLTRNLRIQNQPCDFTGVINFINISRGEYPTCKALPIRAYRFFD